MSLYRSLLFVPGHHPARIGKALASAADAAIIDLEDAVPASEKGTARDNAAAALADRGEAAVFVRINGFTGGDCLLDLEAVVRTGLAGVILPKAESAAQLQVLDWALGQLEAQRGLPAGGIELLPLLESARGVEDATRLAGAATRVRRLSYGVADYSLDLGIEPDADESQLAYLRARLVHASRAAGLAAPVDSVVVEIRDRERLRQSSLRARSMGFGGKLCLHPDQVTVVNEVFRPSQAELAHARAVVEAFDAARERGEAAITVDGAFVDAPVAARARRLVQDAG